MTLSEIARKKETIKREIARLQRLYNGLSLKEVELANREGK